MGKRIEQNEARYEKPERHNETLLQAVKKYENKIEELIQIGQKDENRITSLETQNQRLVDMIEKSANEQVKMTQGRAQLVTGAQPLPTSSPPPRARGHHSPVEHSTPTAQRLSHQRRLNWPSSSI